MTGVMFYLSSGGQGLAGLLLGIGDDEPVSWEHFQHIKAFLQLDIHWVSFASLEVLRF